MTASRSNRYHDSDRLRGGRRAVSRYFRFEILLRGKSPRNCPWPATSRDHHDITQRLTETRNYTFRVLYLKQFEVATSDSTIHLPVELRTFGGSLLVSQIEIWSVSPK